MRLAIEKLGKQYRADFWGLQDFSLEVESGVIGILGPNGAGKSTLFRMLSTVTKPSAGRIIWDNFDVSHAPDRYRAQLGYLPQDFGVYPNLNAIEFLSYLAAARGLVGKPAKARIMRLLELVNLAESRNVKLGSMSGGMKQRVGIAQALLNDPQILIVDEPTAGLDPEERIRFRDLLGELASDRVVLLSSHIVSDIEAVASKVAVVARGRLRIYKTPSDMLKLVENLVWEIETDEQSLERIRSRFIVSSTVHLENRLKVRMIGSSEKLEGARQVVPSLEDAYLHCLNQEINE